MSSSPIADRAPGGAAALLAPRSQVFVVLGLVGLAVSMAVGIAWGAADIGVGDVMASVVAHVRGTDGELDRISEAIIWKMRAPRVVLAACVGAGLAMCGAVLQALTRNTLADPYLLGISAGASTGAVAVLVLGIGAGAGLISLAAGAFVGSLVAFGAVLALIGRSIDQPTRVVLAGVAISQLFAAITSLVLMSSADADRTQSVVGWLLGSLAAARWESVLIAAVVLVVGGGTLWAHANVLNAFTFGRDAAAGLGIDPARVSAGLLVVAALLTASLVAVSGAIGFVGLVVPHMARMLGATDHRWMLPLAAVLGALFLVWADLVARVAFVPQQIPVGVVTALVGVPVFAVILRRRGAERQ